MSSAEPARLDRPEPRALVVGDLVDRTRARLDSQSESSIDELVEDTLWHERRRAERGPSSPTHLRALDQLGRALQRGGRSDRQTALLAIAATWADEVHGRFDPRVHRFATRAAPRLLAGLLRAPDTLRGARRDDERRVVLSGHVEAIRTLAETSTLIVVPTHVSNLDSPLVGLALHEAGLPPFLYGAGLNLFSNAWLGWWMHRLGAYTVDRTKKARLYLDLLKDYSQRAVARGQHSLFFPGGTRARSGAVEHRVKKGLLGTGVAGWQEAMRAGRSRDVAFVPLTLSYQLVLEAGTLIRDHLAEVGQRRAIITDDESAASRTVLQFLRRVIDLDATVVLHFGRPLDIVGRPLPVTAVERAEAAVRRARLVTDNSGAVVADAQRDAVYTELLASALVGEWRTGAVWMSTHAAAWAAWTVLGEMAGTTDPFRLVRVPAERRALPLERVLGALATGLDRVRAAEARGEGACRLPDTPRAVLDAAAERFGRWHRGRALRVDADRVVIDDPTLCLYYANRSPFAAPSPGPT